MEEKPPGRALPRGAPQQSELQRERLHQHRCNSCCYLGMLGQATAPAQPSHKSTEEQAHLLQLTPAFSSSDAFITIIALYKHSSLACCIT